MEKGKVYDQHAQNKEFLSKLSFYKDEIGLLQGRLDEVAGKNSVKDCLVDVERFQNQLLIQRNNIDEIKHLVNEDETRLIKEIEKNAVAVDHRAVEFHTLEEEQVESFERNFNALRHEMYAFFSKWM